MKTLQSEAVRSAVAMPPQTLSPHEADVAVEVQEQFEIETADGERLAATLHAPAGRAKGAVQVNPGMGITRQFYRHFAKYLASRGYVVLTFDPRGMGDSRRGPLRRSKARLSDWARKDMAAALDWLAQHYPALPRFAVGHSLGGQITGLMPNHGLLSGLVLVFAPEGKVYLSTLKGKLQGLLFLGLYMPLTIPLFGYAPVRFLMAAQDLPAGVAWDWIKWTFHFRWIAGIFASRSEPIYYDKIKAPILALALEGDQLAPPKNCARMLRNYYSGGDSEFVVLRNERGPKSAQLSHLGYFRRKFADSHWSQVLSWLDKCVGKAAKPEPQTLNA